MEQNLNNSTALFEAGVASKLEVENAELALLSSKTSKDSAIAQMQDAMAQLSDSMQTISAIMNKATVVAPVSGVVTVLSAESGGFASPQAPMAIIAEDAHVLVTAHVSETLLPYLAVGDEVGVGIASLNQESSIGTIKEISISANPQTKLYAVDISIVQDVAITEGVFADLTFYTDKREDVIAVPTHAIIQKASGAFVFVEEDGIAVEIPVETGLADTAYTEITSGLMGGETLVTTGQSYLKNGGAIRIIPKEV